MSVNRARSQPVFAVAVKFAAIVSTSGACVGAPVFIGGEDLAPTAEAGPTVSADASDVSADASDMERVVVPMDSPVVEGSVVADSSPILESSMNVPDAPICVGNLSNIGTADFHISFTITTTQIGFVALFNQRSLCNTANFWDIRMLNGAIDAQTDSIPSGTPSRFTEIFSIGPVINDGVPHTVLISRVSGLMTVYIDGVSRGTGQSTALFGLLMEVRAGLDVCIGVDQTLAFDSLNGTLDKLCVTSP